MTIDFLIAQLTLIVVVLLWITVGLIAILHYLVEDRNNFGTNYRAFATNKEYIFISLIILVLGPISWLLYLLFRDV